MSDVVIDLRSDTVTRPSPPMRAAMAAAEVGDDVFGEDPTVNKLQDAVAAYLGKEAGLFTASGTMSNQVALRTLCRGAEAICEAEAHFFHYEMAGAAANAGVQLWPVAAARGVLRWGDIEPCVRPELPWFPRTGLICLENTHNRAGGAVVPLAAMAEVARGARARGIPVYLDGARLWNAAVATATPASAFAAYADAVSVCFSKGLGAPVGSCLCGSRDFVAAARSVRQAFGGAMRQVGIIAAAALYALEHNVERLAEDHRRARELAEEAANIDGLAVEMPDTNIVYVEVTAEGFDAPALQEALARESVLALAEGPRRLRMVTHLGLSDDDIARARAALARAVAAAAAAA